jgi:hypothetical protein
MSETAAGRGSEGRSPGAVDTPASGEAATRFLPAVTARPIPAAKMGPDDEQTVLRFTQLPKEAGWLLITAGVVGLVVPGILGTPFLLAGAVVVAPGGSNLLSRWAGRNPPKIVHSAMRQINRFIDDLERRYPRR